MPEQVRSSGGQQTLARQVIKGVFVAASPLGFWAATKLVLWILNNPHIFFLTLMMALGTGMAAEYFAERWGTTAEGLRVIGSEEGGQRDSCGTVGGGLVNTTVRTKVTYMEAETIFSSHCGNVPAPNKSGGPQHFSNSENNNEGARLVPAGLPSFSEEPIPILPEDPFCKQPTVISPEAISCKQSNVISPEALFCKQPNVISPEALFCKQPNKISSDLPLLDTETIIILQELPSDEETNATLLERPLGEEPTATAPKFLSYEEISVSALSGTTSISFSNASVPADASSKEESCVNVQQEPSYTKETPVLEQMNSKASGKESPSIPVGSKYQVTVIPQELHEENVCQNAEEYLSLATTKLLQAAAPGVTNLEKKLPNNPYDTAAILMGSALIQNKQQVGVTDSFLDRNKNSFPEKEWGAIPRRAPNANKLEIIHPVSTVPEQESVEIVIPDHIRKVRPFLPQK